MAEFVTSTGQDSASVLAVSGDLDISEVENFLSHAGRLLDTGTRVIDVDLGGVTFIDSSGLGALVRLQRRATEDGRELRLANVPRAVARVLDLTGLTDLFAERPES
jgi:anti-sigma B factor antagonist